MFFILFHLSNIKPFQCVATQPLRSNDHYQRKHINYKKAVTQSSERNLEHATSRNTVTQKLRLKFGLSPHTKIIICGQDEITLNRGKVAVINAEGTNLICTAHFFNLSSSQDIIPSESSSSNYSSTKISQQPYIDPNISDLDDKATLDEKIEKLNKFHSSSHLSHDLLSQNLSLMFPVLYCHAQARGEVKSNASIRALPRHLQQGKMFAVGHRSEALVGRHQRRNIMIGKCS